jgi:hypothetical protein
VPPQEKVVVLGEPLQATEALAASSAAAVGEILVGEDLEPASVALPHRVLAEAAVALEAAEAIHLLSTQEFCRHQEVEVLVVLAIVEATPLKAEVVVGAVEVLEVPL